jgi:uncharacterized membrane protein YcaP (DUF421 family)
MELVVRTVVIYAIVLLVIRASGKRTLADISAFEAVLLLIVSEAASQALLAEDPSITGAAISITALVLLDRLMAVLEWRFDTLSKLDESVPLLLVVDGQPLHEHLRRSHVRVDEVLSQARLVHGLERLDQIKYAVLEASGGISVVPSADPAPCPDPTGGAMRTMSPA